MNRWNQYTLFRLLVFFAFGILFESGFGVQFRFQLWIFIVLIVLLVTVNLAFSRFKAYSIRWLPGIFLAFIMFTFGFEWSRLNDHRSRRQHLVHHYSGSEPVLARVKGPLEIRPNSFKVHAQVLAIETDSTWLKTSGEILLYFPKDSVAENIAYGDRLIIYARLNEPSLPANPGEFNYRRFLENKNIHYQAYVKPEQWSRTGSGFGNPIVRFSHKLRNTFIRVFENHGVSGRDFSVATALILGMDDYLDNDTRKEFSSAGAMHVLCVSGLHVGVIFLVLNGMLFFLQRNRYTRLLRSILLLLGIWFYALLTGLSPSVLRASTMFSFIILGMSMNRRANIYNSLAASAFVLLLYNPYLIREVGFQLSYIAVLAIVSIQPKLYMLWRPENWFLDKVWAITTVSIAAQIGTAPLGLYYFHQFPNYFIVTNLLVIPLASLILYAGFLTVILSPIPILSGWVSWLLVVFLKAMNFSVAFVDGLPYSATTGVFISMLEMMIIFLIIMAGFRALTFRRTALLKLTLLFMVMLSTVGLIRQFQRANQQQLVVYALRNDVAIDLIYGRHGLMILDSAKLSDPSVLEFHVAGHHVRCGIRSPRLISFNELNQENDSLQTEIPLKTSYPFVQFANQLLMIIDSETPAIHVENPLETGMLIVIDGHPDPRAILHSFQASQVIVSNKVPPWNVSKWREACLERKIPIHVIRDDGAFIWNLRDHQKAISNARHFISSVFSFS